MTLLKLSKGMKAGNELLTNYFKKRVVDAKFILRTFISHWFSILSHLERYFQSSFFFFSVLFPKAPQYIVVYSNCEYLWLCYVGHHLSMAWWVVPCLHPGSKPAKPWAWAAEVEQANLTTWPRGRPPEFLL